ncbi:MAG: hypothetical protein Q9160_006843 [Pyrenula sp. 1 TL-2023]
MSTSATFPVPRSGIELQPGQKHQDSSLPKPGKPPQAIALNLDQSTIHDLLKSLRQNERARLRFGRKQVIHWGDKSKQVYARPEVNPSELYVSGDGNLESYFFSGSFSHRVELEKPRENPSDGDEALAELTQSLNALKEEASSNEARILTNRDGLKALTGATKNRLSSHLSPRPGQSVPLRREGLLGSVNRSTNSSPHLNATKSPAATPNLGPTSAPFSKPTVSTKEQVRLDAIKIPLTHLLAQGPQSLKSIVLKTRASQDDCQKVLVKYAQETIKEQGQFKLRDKAYKDLDIWKFPYPTTKDRQSVVDKAISAFDRLRLARNDSHWQLLLPEEERGKGKCLSRLNFDGKQQNVQPHASNTQKAANSSKSERKADVDKDAMPKAASKISGVDGPTQKKSTTTKESSISKRPNNATSKPSQPGKKNNKTQAKYKSSERIEDSDEDIDLSDGQVSETTQPKRQQANGVGRKAPPVTEKKPPASQKGDPSRSAKPSTNNDRSRFLSGLNGRPRAASSPQKPSPLASSPPTNATDMENSSKASPNSSAASTPPSAASINKAVSRQPPKAKPSSSNSSQSNKSSTSITTSSRPAKRPADATTTSNIAAPPPKRHQPNGISTSNLPPSSKPNKSQPNGNGHHSHHTNTSSSTTSSSVSISGSTSSATEPPSPTTPYTFESLFELSKRFGVAYKAYETLHGKLEREEKPDAREMEKLLRMHQRVAEMKEEMSRGWGEVNLSINGTGGK